MHVNVASEFKGESKLRLNSMNESSSIDQRIRDFY